MQRLRITFSRGDELKYISHLDIMRLWQRVMRRADIPLAYSQGFSPHPKLSLAAPLSIGTTSAEELMDIFLERRISPYFFMKNVSAQLPAGISVSEVKEVMPGVPSLQSQVRYAEYAVTITTYKGPEEVSSAISSLLAREALPWQHIRDKEIRKYNLRPLIANIWVIHWEKEECTLGMLLRCDSAGTGRPEQVSLALGFSDMPGAIHRTRLILAEDNGAPTRQFNARYRKNADARY